MQGKKYLIINADDFGMSEKLNKGIIKSIKKGIVKSVSILPNFPFTEDAIKLAKKYKLDVGLHINLTHGKSFTNPKWITNKEGFFKFKSYPFYALKCTFLKKSIIEKEILAQINFLENRGLTLSHFDTHKNVQLVPRIGKIIIKIAKEKNLVVRNINEKLGGGLFSRQFAKILYTAFSSWILKRRLRKNKILHNRHFYGMLFEINPSKKEFLKIILKLKPGINEFSCHPGYFDEKIDSFLKENRVKELEILTDKEVYKYLKEKKIILISWAELKKGNAEN